MDQQQITEFVLDVINGYAARMNGEVSERVLNEVSKHSKSFKSLMDNHGYHMSAQINEEGACAIQFANADGQVYTTYTFCNVLKVGDRH